MATMKLMTTPKKFERPHQPSTGWEIEIKVNGSSSYKNMPVIRCTMHAKCNVSPRRHPSLGIAAAAAGYSRYLGRRRWRRRPFNFSPISHQCRANKTGGRKEGPSGRFRSPDHIHHSSLVDTYLLRNSQQGRQRTAQFRIQKTNRTKLFCFKSKNWGHHDRLDVENDKNKNQKIDEFFVFLFCFFVLLTRVECRSLGPWMDTRRRRHTGGENPVKGAELAFYIK